MHQRTSSWLLVSLFALVVTSPVLWGQVATDNPVVAAARDGDVRAVRALIAKGAKVNDPAKDQSTALLWAAYHSDLEMTRALLAAGAKVDAPNQLRDHAAHPGEPHRRRRRSSAHWCAPARRPRWRRRRARRR